ncbi:type II secretion system F family protein [Clostridium grantii]|uniref:Type II secretory pathway, component PulF n=1 Tax=Clostridium grantii DSM 8605 TaxID=1121316 RepID=A0A1M5SG72_9CLOT|nr:type II secretion system F family protein [Clostridium grantii]SHH37587.1 Type II secretory pathway, component PulF [Clostridium grantii DSM 8605]
MVIKYFVYNLEGKKIKKESLFESIEEFYSYIKDKKLILYKYKILSSKQFNSSLGNRYKMLENLCDSFYQIEGSGLSLKKGMKLIIETIKDKRLKKILEKVNEDMNAGNTFYNCFGKYPKIFPEFFITMLSIGEKTDNLESIFKQLKDFYSLMHKISSTIVRSFIYPIVVIILALISFIYMKLKFQPMIQSLSYENTNNLQVINKWSWINSIWLLPVIILFIYIICFICKKQFNIKMNIWSVLPTKHINNLIFQFKLLNSMLLSVSSGETLKFAFQITKDSLSNVYYKSILEKGIESLETGNTLSKSLKEMKVIKLIIIATISIGEETNSLEKALEKCLKNTVIEIENKTKKISILVEPLLMLLLGVFITYFMVSIFTPLLNMMDNI